MSNSLLTCRLVRARGLGDKIGMALALARSIGTVALDFVLPPRCAGCGTIVDEVHGFCAECWTRVDFLGHSGCATCGLPLAPTDAEQCGACLTDPGPIARTRAAVAYDDISSGITIRLKYGRKVALARTMARFIAPLMAGDSADRRLLVPVPLHRWRLWSRGFNQSALVARELSRRSGIATDPFVLARTRSTPPLKGMSASQRHRTVAGAFAVREAARVKDKTIVLVDDVLTTGSTARACARTLLRAGAAQVELLAWARVIPSGQRP
jgi:ComF family protein